MSAPNLTSDQNLLPVQAYFNLDGSFNTFIGQGQPFYATFNPSQSGLNITNSTINSTTIGLVTPSTGAFTNISTTTGSISTSPSNPTDIVNKLYVDSTAAGLSWKQPVLCATTANITLSGLQTIDTVSVTAGSRVLVKNQSNQAQNGLYIASAGAWTYSTDGNTWNDYVSAICFVESGGQAGSAWYCYVQPGGTLGTTAITWSQFSTSATYSAGTGLTLSAFTFSITPVGTAGTYGSASQVPVFVTNASGQVTSVTNTSISIPASAINTTIPNSGLTNSTISGVALGGNLFNLTAGTNVTFSSGTTYNGSAAITINASSTMVYPGAGIPNSTGSAWGTSYSTTGSGTVVALATSPTLVTPILGTPQSGNFSSGTFTWPTFNQNTTGNAATATTATNLAGTTQYSLPYQSASATTAFLSPGTSGSLLMTLGSIAAPIWVATSSLTVATATNIGGGAAGSVPYQSASNTTTFLALGTSGYVLTAGASAPQYTAQSSLAVGTATNLAGGAASQIPYQTGSGATTFLANGTTGQVLTSNGASAPSWTTPTAYATVTDDTTTNATRYPLFANQTSGNITTEYTSSTKYQYNPSTGALTAGSMIANKTITGSANTGAFSYGTLSYSDVDIFASSSLSVNNYVQSIQQNTNNGTSSSADYIVSNDNGTATTYYGDFGITSSGFNSPSTNITNTPNTVYLQSVTTGLAIGTLNAYAVTFYTNSTQNAQISSSGVWTFTNTITGSISGNAGTATTATTATNATNIAITDNTTSTSTYYPVMSVASSGNNPATTSSTKLSFKPSTGALTASQLIIAP